MKTLFPYFGGKSSVVELVWNRLGSPKQYIEPFCGSAAMLFGAPAPASLEVINDVNGFIANFWRAAKHQPDAVAFEADYPVSHIDLGARHGWLMAQRERLGTELQDPFWPGDARVAGWWLWGQCSWIGGGWCEWSKGQVPHVSNAGRGIQAIGRVPHVSDAGRGIQAIGQVPHVSDAGRGIQAIGQVPHVSSAGMGDPDLLTSSGAVALRWLRQVAARLERVRVVHGDWDRCLNNHYGAGATAVFLDPPYRKYEALYSTGGSVADAVEAWALANQHLRVCIAGHVGDYPTLAGWDCAQWKRGSPTYGSTKTTDQEALWFSPACIAAKVTQPSLFGEVAP